MSSMFRFKNEGRELPVVYAVSWLGDIHDNSQPFTRMTLLEANFVVVIKNDALYVQKDRLGRTGPDTPDNILKRLCECIETAKKDTADVKL